MFRYDWILARYDGLPGATRNSKERWMKGYSVQSIVWMLL